ncbi:MAG: thioesterase domain-containing protein, partial [Vicinamibacteria bacterium]
ADATGRSRLVAYVVEGTQGVPAADLRAFLCARLPLSLVPARFLRLKALPLNTSRKLDRAALPRPPAFDRIPTEPRTEMERTLLDLFKTTLQLETAGIDDDFFECGGDSLGAFTLVTRIAEITGTVAPASLLLEAPTVKRLAAALESQSRDGVWISRLNGAGPTSGGVVACVPGVVGDPMVFSPIASLLKGDYGLLGISLVGLQAPWEGARIVDEVVVRLRAAQPDGPYRLLGYSIGGILAFHLASRLIESGQRVSFLGMIDTSVPGQPRLAPSSSAEITAHTLRRARNHALPGQQPEAVRARRGLAEALRRLPLVPAALAITLFRAMESRLVDPTHGWGPLAQHGVDIEPVPGRHTDVMDAQYGQALAEAVRRALKRGDATHSR